MVPQLLECLEVLISECVEISNFIISLIGYILLVDLLSEADVWSAVDEVVNQTVDSVLLLHICREVFLRVIMTQYLHKNLEPLAVVTPRHSQYLDECCCGPG